MYFQYDTSGVPFGFIYNDVQYFYITNQMGDVIAITDTDGTVIASYTYDTWGGLLDVTGTNADIATANPIRYRGYYYDTESGYYYLQSRYYDPSICRFINSDIAEIANMSKGIPVGTNLFSYCNNDAVNNSDSTGFLSKINAAVYLIIFITCFVAPILLKDKKNKYTFETSRIIIDKTGLCLAKIKYYKSKWKKKSFQVVLGGKSDWANRTNVNNNLNMDAINYHANNINSIVSRAGTTRYTKADAIQSNIYSFYIACYLIDANITTAKIKYQYSLLWGKYIGKFRNSKAKVILCRILKGGSLNGWYYFF